MNKTSRLTLYFLKWIYYRKRDGELMEVISPQDIRGMHIKYTHRAHEAPSESFMRGMHMVDYDALFDWICDQRQYEVASKHLWRYLLRTVRDGR